MGPVVGSLAFAQEPVRGLIAVEIVGTSWFEYDLERLRVQAGVPARRRKRSTAKYANMSRVRTDSILRRRRRTPLPGRTCKDFLQPFGAVPPSYMQAVADISLGKQWRNADFPVLVIYPWRLR